MKVIIAGSRDYCPTYDELDAIVEKSGFTITTLLSGCCPSGVDFISWRWAFSRYVERKAFPAEWTKHGRVGGPIRNRRMADVADALILIWDGKSKGSASMKKEMVALGKPVFEVLIINSKTFFNGKRLEAK